MVPPGIYILRLDVDAHSQSSVQQTAMQRVLYVSF